MSDFKDAMNKLRDSFFIDEGILFQKQVVDGKINYMECGCTVTIATSILKEIIFTPMAAAERGTPMTILENELGWSKGRLKKEIEGGYLPEPESKIPGIVCPRFSPDQVKEIMTITCGGQFFPSSLDSAEKVSKYTVANENRRRDGFLNKRECVLEAGCSYIVMNTHRSTLPVPSTLYPGCRGMYYTPQQSREVVEFLKTRVSKYKSKIAELMENIRAGGESTTDK